MIGTYVAFIALAGLSMLGIDNPFLLIGIALAVSIVVASAYGFSIERVAYRPLRSSKRLIALISAIGMSIFLQNYIRLAQGSRDIAMPSMIKGGFLFGSPEGSHIMISYMQVIIMVTTVLCMVGLTLFITRSRMGRACRACAQDIGMTNLLGINSNNVIAVTFIIGASLAAVAGMLLGLYYGVVNPYIGFIAGLKAFTAAVLGGIGSIPGAMLGGLILGVSESLTGGYLTAEYKDVVAFSLLILILLFMPQGILGKPEVEKI